MASMACYGEERTGYVEPAWRPMPTEREMTPEEMFEAGLLTAEALERHWAREESLLTVSRAHEVHAWHSEYEFGEGELAA